jgi:signal transduction histidine kinase
MKMYRTGEKDSRFSNPLPGGYHKIIPRSFLSKIIFLFRSKIAVQLLVVFFLIFFALILSQAVIMHGAFKKRLLNNYMDFSVQNVRQTAHNAGYLLAGPEEKLKSLKMFLETAELKEIDKEALILRASAMDDSLQYISLLDTEGREIHCSEPEKKLKDIRKEPWFRKAAGGEACRTPVFISGEYTPVIIEALPVKDMGKTGGVLYAEITMSGLWDYIDSISKDPYGSFFIVSKEGVLCSYKDKKMVMRAEDEPSRKIASAAVKALSRPDIVTLEDDKQYMICAAALKDLQLYLVYQQDVKYIFQELKRVDILIALVSSLIILTALFAIGWISRRFSSPILKLVKNLDYVGTRNLQNEQENRLDEIGSLYRAFYDMNKKIMEAKAREKLAIVGESAMGISHEIKNPITVIKNFIQLVIENPDDREIRDKFSRAVPSEMYRIESLLEDLSSLSLGREINKGPCRLSDIISDIGLLFENEFKNHDVRFQTLILPSDTSLSADADRLKSVFINLVKNSLDAMPKGGVISIDVQTREMNKKKHLAVIFRDNGSGISPEVLKNIFNPFFTTKKRGLGIGLTITRGIIDQHNGEMTVSSEGPGNGTTFTIILPV